MSSARKLTGLIAIFTISANACDAPSIASLERADPAEISSAPPPVIMSRLLETPWPGEPHSWFRVGTPHSPQSLFQTARNALNDRGQVLGTGVDIHNADNSDSRVIIWDVGAVSVCCDRRPAYPIGTALNDSGAFVGEMGDPTGAFVREPDGSTRYLLLAPQVTQVFPIDINNHGQVVIFSSGNALLWDHGEVTDLGAGIPWAINDRGRIVGQSGEWAVMWKDGQKIELFPGVAYAVNSSNQVVGTSNGRAVMWSYGTLTDLGPGAAHGINNRVRIVGSSGGRAVLWREGVMIDLGPGLASAINNNHEILVGYSVLSHPSW